MTDSSSGFRTDPLYRRVASMLDEAGVSYRVEAGAKHYMLIYRVNGVERQMPLAHGGGVKRRTELKTIARIRKVCELQRGASLIIGDNNNIVTPEPLSDVSFRLGQIVPFDGQPRIRDLDVAAVLDMKDPHAVRRIILKNLSTLETWGKVPETHRKYDGPGRPGREFWLNRKQALFVTAKSDTPIAALVTVSLVEVFSAWEAHKLVAKPADAAALAERIAELSREIEALKARALPPAAIIVKRTRFVRPSLIRRLAA